MDLENYKEPPKLICPQCQENIVDPKWRLKCFLIPQPQLCPCGKVRLKLVGNYWVSLVIGCCLMIIGGRLLAKDIAVFISLILLVAGVAVVGWGLLTSHLEVAPPDPPKS